MNEYPDRDVVERELDTSADEPAVQVAEAVADIEGVDPTDLPTMHDCVDGVLDRLFSTPPAPEAHMTVEFDYEGHRVTVDQSGEARFVRTE